MTRPNTPERIYRGVPPAQSERLFTFRATHPYHRITVGQSTWRYLACGEGERALLFLPGAFLRADMWFNQILALEEDYRIVAPDAYALQGLFDMDAVCDALVRSLDEERMDRATVIGISAGGGVAQVLLQTHPERVEHAVLSHCGVLDHSTKRDRQTKRILWLVRILPMFLIRRALKRMTTGETPVSSRWVAFHDAYLREAIPTSREVCTPVFCAAAWRRGAASGSTHGRSIPGPGRSLSCPRRMTRCPVPLWRDCRPAIPGPGRSCSLRADTTLSCSSPRRIPPR
jgi:pimeloyl-ACP methyl ester carboxylesterase